MRTHTLYFPTFHLPRFPKLDYGLRSLCALIVCAAMLCVTVGCSTVQIKDAVQEIANTIPAVQPYIDTAAAVASTLDPTAAPLILGATALVQTSLTELQVLLSAYAASPSATTWGSIVDAVNTIVNTNATALLNAAHIVDPTSRARAVELLGALQTALLLIYSIIQRVGDAVTKSTVKAQAAARTVKLSQIKMYLDRQQVETATGVPFDVAYNYEVAQGF